MGIGANGRGPSADVEEDVRLGILGATPGALPRSLWGVVALMATLFGHILEHPTKYNEIL